MDKGLVYSYIREIALMLKEPRKYGEVSVMIGAGFSKNARSRSVSNVQPPDWHELAIKMYCELYPETEDMCEDQKKEWDTQRIIKTSGKNVTKLAEEYIANFDRNKINHLIEEAVADDSFSPGELHKKLLKLNWGDVFTTNYDTLLERAADLIFREKNYKIIYSQNDIPGSKSPRIVKLHGSIPQVKPYIICDEDYRTYPVKNAAMVNTVQQAMLETRLCLIGFSGDDPNFQNWLGWLRDNMGECCPKIYLIGIYDNLSDPERKLLENKRITIIDISTLAEENIGNKYYSAIFQFLDLLEQYQKEKDLYVDRPYPEANWFWKPEDSKKYVQDIKKYSSGIVKWMQPYILLPEKIRKKYNTYFSEHFRILLGECKDLLPIVTIANVIKILRKCSAVLEDTDAACMEEICAQFEYFSDLKSEKAEALMEIGLYLAEMYRVDSKKAEYEKVISFLEKIYERVIWYKNEFLIEKIKNEIGNFEYKKAKALINEIDETSFEYKIKKAGFYKQLSEKELADRILNECSLELAQMKISDDIYASYIGYLNLCYRANQYVISEEYSDANYYKNEYNVRRIIVDQKEELSRLFFDKDCKEEKMLPFNLNTSRSTTYTIGGNEAYLKSFIFLISLDKLCLPLFNDFVSMFPRTLNEVIYSSKHAFWKLSLVARGNNDKVIDQIFTRKMISSLCEEEIKQLFDSLISLAELYTLDDSYSHKKYIVSMKSFLNILSRLVIFMPDENVVQYLKVLSSISKSKDMQIMRDINDIIERISTRFNSKIAVSCHEIIFKDFDSQYHLASYFDFPFEMEIKIVEEYYVNAIELLRKEDIKARDCGVAQILVLWKNWKLEQYTREIEIALWEEKDKLFPKSELYYPFMWEKLPHANTVSFSELYYQYLFEGKYADTVIKSGLKIGTGTSDIVHHYCNFLYCVSNVSTTKVEKVIFDEKLAVHILDIAYQFVESEKELLEIDFFGEKYIAEKELNDIGQLTALVYIESIIEGFIDKVVGKIDSLYQLLEFNHINVAAIDIVKAIEKGNYNLGVEIFENTILFKGKKNYSSAFTGIKCLLFYLEQKKKKDIIVDSFFNKFMNSIKYLDIENAKEIWRQLAFLIARDYFLDADSQKYISFAVWNCIEAYNNSDKKGERYFLDGLYNCIYALQNYYEYVSNSGEDVSQELMDCIVKAKSIENYEVRNIFH